MAEKCPKCHRNVPFARHRLNPPDARGITRPPGQHLIGGNTCLQSQIDDLREAIEAVEEKP